LNTFQRQTPKGLETLQVETAIKSKSKSKL
jgi:hypothetical protein